MTILCSDVVGCGRISSDVVVGCGRLENSRYIFTLGILEP